MFDDTSAEQDRPRRQSPWRPCVDGDLSDFAQRVRSRRKLDRMNRIATASLVLLVAVVVVFTAGQHYSQTSAHCDCGDVHLHMADYLSGNLPLDLAAKIDNHLAYCLGCSEEFHHRTDIAVSARTEGRHYIVPEDQTWQSADGQYSIGIHFGSGECHCLQCAPYAEPLDDQ